MVKNWFTWISFLTQQKDKNPSLKKKKKKGTDILLALHKQHQVPSLGIHKYSNGHQMGIF